MTKYAFTAVSEVEIRMCFEQRDLFALIALTDGSSDWVHMGINRAAREALEGAATAFEIESNMFKGRVKRMTADIDT